MTCEKTAREADVTEHELAPGALAVYTKRLRNHYRECPARIDQVGSGKHAGQARVLWTDPDDGTVHGPSWIGLDKLQVHSGSA